MEITTIAKPYANGIFASANASGTVARWTSFFQATTQCLANADFVAVLQSPQLGKAKKNKCLQAVLSAALGTELSKAEVTLLSLVVDNNRLKALPAIARLFEQLKTAHQGVRHFTIVSAYLLSDDEQKTLKQALEKRFACQAGLQVIVDETLLGGVVIKEGDQIIDDSIGAQLSALKRCLMQ